jgi:DNA-binding CsgD family transcriptional regulator
MTTINLSSVVLDMDIYPRAEWSQPTVERYVEALGAGDRFPPIILEAGTNRLLDGMHRYQAHRRLGRDEIDAEFHEIPDGEPPLLYAAGLSARHGDRIGGRDIQAIVRKVVTEHPDYPMVAIAKRLGITRQTVSKHSSDITERRTMIRKVRALLLNRLGWSTRQIAEFLAYSQKQVSNDVNDDIITHLNEDLLRGALDDLPEECRSIAEEIREERIFASWSDRERELLKRLRSGETVIVSMRDTAHPNLVRWAEDADLFVRIDRRSDWGNPFEMPGDGDRETVIRNYAEHYLPYKPSLLSRLDELRGKALGCWCAPEACHGDILIAFARGEGFVPGDPIEPDVSTQETLL